MKQLVRVVMAALALLFAYGHPDWYARYPAVALAAICSWLLFVHSLNGVLRALRTINSEAGK